MKKRLSYILISMLLCMCIIACVIGSKSLYISIQQSKANLNIEIIGLLKQATEENGKIKNKNIPNLGDHNNRPKLFGSSETRTFCNADTAFTYQHKITDIHTELNQRNQHFLLLTNQLHSSDVEYLLDSLLRNANINAQIAIGITSTGYPQKDLPWSKDTLRMNIHGRTHYIMEADFTQIHYAAYLEYSLPTLWKRIEDKTIIYLWGIVTLMTAASIAIVYIYFLKKENKSKEIIENGRTLASPESVSVISKETEENEQVLSSFQIEEEYIIFGNRKKRLAPQSKQILQMFLEAEDHRIEKIKLKKLWSKRDTNPISNMTSAVKRINDTFEEIGCKLEIITDPKNRDFYLLQ